MLHSSRRHRTIGPAPASRDGEVDGRSSAAARNGLGQAEKNSRMIREQFDQTLGMSSGFRHCQPRSDSSLTARPVSLTRATM